MTGEITITRGNESVVLTEGRLKELTSKFLESCADEAANYDDFNMSSKMVDMLLKAKQVWYPATQKNLNVNIDTFEDKMKTWLNLRKEELTVITKPDNG